MSGHSKWHSIRHKKGALDAKRGKIFTKHAKLITIAARDGGGDPEMNPGLRTAIANAKADNVPNNNIEKAIKKGSGEDKNAADIVEIMYEGFGPANGVFYVHAITDNRNRAVASIKTVFTKNGGQMGEAGTVAWMFDKRGILIVKNNKLSKEEAELAAIESGAHDLSWEDKKLRVITEATDLMKVRDKLEEKDFEIEKAEQIFIAKNPIEIDNLVEAKKLMQLNEALEDNEEVANVYSNFDFSDEVIKALND